MKLQLKKRKRNRKKRRMKKQHILQEITINNHLLILQEASKSQLLLPQDKHQVKN
jgi:hypothetical protein